MNRNAYHILLSLLEVPSTPNDILDRIEQAEGATPPVTSFYRDLKRALDAGWIELRGTVSQEGRGRPSQTYRITKQGRRAVRQEARKLEKLSAIGLSSRG